MPDINANSPVLPPLASYMKVDFLFNDDGNAWLLHDKPLPDLLEWVEYDVGQGTLTLLTRQGKTQALGLPVPAKMVDRLRNTMQISIILMKDGKIGDMAIVPLNVLEA